VLQERAAAGEVLNEGDGSRSVATASSSHYTRSGRLTRARRAELIEVRNRRRLCAMKLVGGYSLVSVVLSLTALPGFSSSAFQTTGMITCSTVAQLAPLAAQARCLCRSV